METRELLARQGNHGASDGHHDFVMNFVPVQAFVTTALQDLASRKYINPAGASAGRALCSRRPSSTADCA